MKKVVLYVMAMVLLALPVWGGKLNGRINNKIITLKPLPYHKGIVKEEIGRFVDKQAGVLCYTIINGSQTAISCVPLKDTRFFKKIRQKWMQNKRKTVKGE